MTTMLLPRRSRRPGRWRSSYGGSSRCWMGRWPWWTAWVSITAGQKKWVSWTPSAKGQSVHFPLPTDTQVLPPFSSSFFLFYFFLPHFWNRIVRKNVKSKMETTAKRWHERETWRPLGESKQEVERVKALTRTLGTTNSVFQPVKMY